MSNKLKVMDEVGDEGTLIPTNIDYGKDLLNEYDPRVLEEVVPFNCPEYKGCTTWCGIECCSSDTHWP